MVRNYYLTAMFTEVFKQCVWSGKFLAAPRAAVGFLSGVRSRMTNVEVSLFKPLAAVGADEHVDIDDVIFVLYELLVLHEVLVLQRSRL